MKDDDKAPWVAKVSVGGTVVPMSVVDEAIRVGKARGIERDVT